MKKVAVAVDAGSVSQHFGHCGALQIFTIENDNIAEPVSVENPGHCQGALPDMLKAEGVTVVIAGGMGAGARGKLAERGITAVTGASGEPAAAVRQFLDGALVNNGIDCSAHGHNHHGHGIHGSGGCGGHGHGHGHGHHHGHGSSGQ